MEQSTTLERFRSGMGRIRRVASDGKDVNELAKRTLTNLYNKPPEWLRQAHQALDAAVFAAYGWDPAMTDDELLAALLEVNLRRAKSG